MYRSAARNLLSRYVERPVASVLARTGVHPNVITLLGLALAGGSAYLLSGGHLLAGALVLLASGVADLLDGMVARWTKRETPFGAVLDSVADRLGEAGVLLGLLVFYLTPPNVAGVILVYLALAGSVMVSYLRARSEGLGIQYSGGLMTRPERVLVLVVGLLINQVSIALGVIAVFAFLTVGQRLWYIRKHTAGAR
ncbi:MAG: CDP-alcohol phosphatidyltransferase family protein [Chloroflexi bacterium]|nr:CDP-alcohol phosphatidyltransferase family protein [Chloroflexota bacterium]